MSSPFRRMNGNAGKPTVKVQEAQQLELKGMSREAFDQIQGPLVMQQVQGTFNNLPPYQLATPLAVMLQGPDGKVNTQIHTGMRRREAIAKDFMAALICARIRNPGVLGQNEPIPAVADEIRAMAQQAHLAAALFVDEAVRLEQQDIDGLKMRFEHELERKYTEANMPGDSPSID